MESWWSKPTYSAMQVQSENASDKPCSKSFAQSDSHAGTKRGSDPAASTSLLVCHSLLSFVYIVRTTGNMYSRSVFLTLAAASISLVSSEGTGPEGICYSYGVDFVDEGSYFINSQSTEDFTAVSYFQGCNDDKADVLLVAPEDTPGETEFLCDKVRTTPENENKLSTCPIKKNQMASGHWLLLVLGNNGKGGQPFAWQRGTSLTPSTQLGADNSRSLPDRGPTGHYYFYTNSDLACYHHAYYYSD
jgi:hypothetical protein